MIPSRRSQSRSRSQRRRSPADESSAVPTPADEPSSAASPSEPVHSPRNPAQNPPRNPTQTPAQNPPRNPAQNPTQNPPRNPTQTPPRNPAQTPAQNPAQTPNPSIDPSIAAIVQPVYEGETYRFTEDGKAFESRAKDTYVVATKWEQCDLLPDFAATEHLFFVPQDVSAAEVEALAVSVWDSAGWLFPGILGLFNEVTLSGPWRINRDLGKKLGLPAVAAWGYSVQCPRDRMKPPKSAPSEETQALFEADVLYPLFEGELPVGDEFQTLSYLLDIATRLGGGLRSDTGKVLVPDPDSLVNLSVFARDWVPRRELESWVHHLGAEAQALESTSGQYSKSSMSSSQVLDAENSPQLRAQIPVALGALDGAREDYMLQVSCGQQGTILVEAGFTAAVPAALRWEDWANGLVASYALTWLPSDERLLSARRPSRRLRMERLEVTSFIESLAALLCERAEGVAIDDGGFIVAFES